MTAVLPGRATAPVAAAASTEPAVEQRGRTTIADRVVEKIAVQAVAEVDSATGAARRVLGVGLSTASPTTPARVDARVDGNVVLVEVSMSVVWPASVRAVTRDVRRHVTEQVRALTGLQVAEVDITVPALVAAGREKRSRVI